MAQFNEKDHPREDDGKFTRGGFNTGDTPKETERLSQIIKQPKYLGKSKTDKKEIAVKGAIKKIVEETNAPGFQIPNLVRLRLSGEIGGNASHDYVTQLYSQMRRNGEI